MENASLYKYNKVAKYTNNKKNSEILFISNKLNLLECDCDRKKVE